MARYSELLIGGNFASGATPYEDHYYGESERAARIVLTVIINDRVTTRAVLDTGAPWSILNPETAEDLGLTEAAPHTSLPGNVIRGITYPGRLHRVKIILPAEDGSSLEIEPSIFVPQLQPGEEWGPPNFIGMGSFLDHVRFAIDPAENIFYFSEA